MTKTRLLSFLMAMAVLTTLLIPASASEIEPRDSRFKYYTVTDPNWTFSQRMTVTAAESNQFQSVEDKLWNLLSKAAGDVVTNADDYINDIHNFVRQNNLDFTDAGTYTIYFKNKIRYKEHLSTGAVYVELRQRIMKIDFVSSEKTSSRELTFTLQ